MHIKLKYIKIPLSNFKKTKIYLKKFLFFYFFDFFYKFLINFMFLFQGFSILICFVLKAEVKFKSQSSKNVCSKKMLEDNFCSGSINSPLSCE